MSGIFGQVPLSQFGWFLLDAALAVSILGGIFKFVHPLMTKLSHMVDDWNGRDGEPSIPEKIRDIEKRQAKVEQQLDNHMQENEDIRRYVKRNMEHE